jgi:hypothetical protein
MKSRVIQDDPNTGEGQTPGDTANLLEKQIESREADAERGAVDNEPVEPRSKAGA